MEDIPVSINPLINAIKRDAYSKLGTMPSNKAVEKSLSGNRFKVVDVELQESGEPRKVITIQEHQSDIMTALRIAHQYNDLIDELAAEIVSYACRELIFIVEYTVHGEPVSLYMPTISYLGITSLTCCRTLEMFYFPELIDMLSLGDDIDDL